MKSLRAICGLDISESLGLEHVEAAHEAFFESSHPPFGRWIPSVGHDAPNRGGALDTGSTWALGTCPARCQSSRTWNTSR